MLYKKFETNDLFFNVLKTKPRFEFKIYDGETLINNGSRLASLNNIHLSSSYTPSVLLNGLGGYWKLDGNADDSLNLSNGTITGSFYQWSSGKIGQSYGLISSDSSSYINLGYDDSIKPTTAISIAGWFNFSGSLTPNARLITDWHQDGGADRWIFGYSTDGNNIYWHKGGVSVLFGTLGSTITSGSWNHLAVTWTQASGSTTYLNGVAINSNIATGGTMVNMPSKIVCIGRQYNTGAGMYGGIDELGIWSRYLTADEITLLYNNGSGVSYPF